MAIRDVPLLGGKHGAELTEALRAMRTPAEHYATSANERIKVRQLLALSFEELTEACGAERGAWLFRYIRGEDDRPVKVKGPPRSLLEAKSVAPLTTMGDVRHWLRNLARNLARRVLEDATRHRRWPKNLVLMVRMSPSPHVRLSAKARGSPGAARSCGPLPRVTRRAISEAMEREKLGEEESDAPLERRGEEAEEAEGETKGARVEMFDAENGESEHDSEHEDEDENATEIAENMQGAARYEQMALAHIMLSVGRRGELGVGCLLFDTHISNAHQP
jgi:hypothetical protein